ncbi:MAG: hypothetical protein GYB65_20180 [Chloroflexi bacterium]|nr:hypothetical protein [Chloroflexota bacterium]
MRRLVLWGTLLLLVMGLAACELFEGDDERVLPTLVDLTQLPTHDFLTQNAPPEGFSEVEYDPLDISLSTPPGWAATVTARFVGSFDDTGEPADSTYTAHIRTNNLVEGKAVVLEVNGSGMVRSEWPTDLRFESVRFGTEYWFLFNNECTKNETALGLEAQVSDLGASALVGGITNAVPDGHRRDIGDYPVWRYTFSPVLPTLTLQRYENSIVTPSAELWISPDLNAVLTYDLTLEVERVTLMWGDRAVSGRLDLRYELDLVAFNIAQDLVLPNGCPG